MSESLKSKKLSRQNDRLTHAIKDELAFSSDDVIQLSNELIEVISKKEGLTYQEVYQALELTYLAVESQSVFAAINPINLHPVLTQK